MTQGLTRLVSCHIDRRGIGYETMPSQYCLVRRGLGAVRAFCYPPQTTSARKARTKEGSNVKIVSLICCLVVLLTASVVSARDPRDPATHPYAKAEVFLGEELQPERLSKIAPAVDTEPVGVGRYASGPFFYFDDALECIRVGWYYSETYKGNSLPVFQNTCDKSIKIVYCTEFGDRRAPACGRHPYRWFGNSGTGVGPAGSSTSRSGVGLRKNNTRGAIIYAACYVQYSLADLGDGTFACLSESSTGGQGDRTPRVLTEGTKTPLALLPFVGPEQ